MGKGVCLPVHDCVTAGDCACVREMVSMSSFLFFFCNIPHNLECLWKMETKPRRLTVRNHKPELSLNIAENHMLNPCHAQLQRSSSSD